MKNKKYHSVRTVPKSNTKNPRNRDKIDTPNTHIHHPSFSWLVTGTSIKRLC